MLPAHRIDRVPRAALPGIAGIGRYAAFGRGEGAGDVGGYDQRVELFGSKGMVVSDNRPENHVTKHVSGATNVSAPLLHFFVERYEAAFNAEIDSFVDAVEGGAAVEVGFEDGRRGLILADAAFLSVAKRRTVEVSEIAQV